MATPATIAAQVDVVARELAVLVHLLGGGSGAASPVVHSAAGSGDRFIDAITAVELAGRLLDCARVRVISPLATDPVLAVQLGYASPVTAVASIARISERSARARLKVAAAVNPPQSLTGATLPAPHPVLSDAVDLGAIGLDAAALIAHELSSIAGRASADVIDATESAMVGLATGAVAGSPSIITTVSVDYLAGEVRQLAAAADPDGARPREERAARRRDFRLGAPDEDGLVPASGRLLPEIGSLLGGLLEAHRRSPRFVDGGTAPHIDFGSDTRTPGQRRHDALGDVVMAAVGAPDTPRLDGQAVTVLVTVSAADLADRDGLDADPIGTMSGSPFPVSRRSIERFIDAGGYRVATVSESGTVTAISSPQRCFTPTQRPAIVARDGLGCLAPGCTSPHDTLQAHHVIPDRDNGPTAVDNGILLCYWHHQIVDTGPWSYRMINGMPFARGPGIREWSPTRRRVSRAA
jgi:hypothetical protein